MTNEEAIKGLKKLRSFHNGSYGEHIDMAIKALEQQPCIEDYPTCTECEHYDKEKHYCPRFCQVIRDTLAEAQPTDADCISRESLRRKLQEHHDFFVNAFGSYKNMTYIDKARVDEINNCIAMAVNEPSVTPQTVTEFADKCTECGKIQNELAEDAVSRKRVIILIDEASEIHPYKVVGDSDTYSNYIQGWSDACDWLYANIDGIPSVTPQRPKGKWKKIAGFEDCHYDKCSVCGVYQLFYYGKPSTNYCPNCGAEMSGGGEDEVSN